MLAAKRFIFITLFMGMVFWAVGRTAVFAINPSDENIDNPIIAIEKTTTTPEIAQGGTAQFAIKVTNSGDVPLTEVVVSDALSPNCNRNIGIMQPTDVEIYFCQQANVQESFLNVATASGRAPNGVVINDKDSALVNVDNPEVSIIKDTTTPIIRRNGTAQFTITVFNDSEDNALTSVEVVDALSPNCDRQLGTLDAEAFISYTCIITNVQEAFNNVATVFGTSPSSGVVEASDSAEIELLDLEMEFTADPSIMPEPGNEVAFTAKITNSGTVDVNLNSLISNRFGDLMDSSNGNVTDNSCTIDGDAPLLVANGGEYVCDFKAIITGQPQVLNIDLTAEADDSNTGDGIDVSETANIAINITDLPSEIVVSLEASETTLSSPGGEVDFTVTVENISDVDTVVVNTLGSNTLGTLHQQGDCELPQTINAGGSYICTYTYNIVSSGGKQVIQEVSVAGQDDDITPNLVTDRDRVTIDITAALVQYLPVNPKQFRLADEPNDICQDAYPVIVDRAYSFAADDNTDWYRFSLHQETDIFLSLTNFAPQAGQAVVYTWDGDDCEPLSQGGSRVVIGNNGNLGSIKSIDLGTLNAGHYLIRVINDGTPTQNKYNLEVQSS